MQVKICDVKLSKESIEELWKAHPVIVRNMDNIVADFHLMNANTIFEVPDGIEDDSVLVKYLSNIELEKTKLLNAHICGVLTAITQASSFISKHVHSPEEQSKIDKEKSEQFAKSVLL